MGASLYAAQGPTAQMLRKRGGAWLKRLREEAGTTQRDVAEALGYSYVTMVSQIERGLGRVPPEDWLKWAELLRQDPKWFAQRMLYWYDPHAHHALFGGHHPQDAENLAREATNANRLDYSKPGVAGYGSGKKRAGRD